MKSLFLILFVFSIYLSIDCRAHHKHFSALKKHARDDARSKLHGSKKKPSNPTTTASAQVTKNPQARMPEESDAQAAEPQPKPQKMKLNKGGKSHYYGKWLKGKHQQQQQEVTENPVTEQTIESTTLTTVSPVVVYASTEEPQDKSDTNQEPVSTTVNPQNPVVNQKQKPPKLESTSTTPMMNTTTSTSTTTPLPIPQGESAEPAPNPVEEAPVQEVPPTSIPQMNVVTEYQQPITGYMNPAVTMQPVAGQVPEEMPQMSAVTPPMVPQEVPVTQQVGQMTQSVGNPVTSNMSVRHNTNYLGKHHKNGSKKQIRGTRKSHSVRAHSSNRHHGKHHNSHVSKKNFKGLKKGVITTHTLNRISQSPHASMTQHANSDTSSVVRLTTGKKSS